MSLVNKIKASVGKTADKTISPSVDVKEWIAVNAFYKAQARGFAPGGELNDWLAAEAEANSSAKVH